MPTTEGGSEWACSICSKPSSTRVRERVPDAKGFSRRSFQAEYWLCMECLKRCSAAGAIYTGQRPFWMAKKKIVIVNGKTYAWLNNLVNGKI